MKHCLLLLGIVVLLAVGAPAHGQFIFMDVNGDTLCDTNDVITDLTTSVDVWLDTNHNAVGSVVTCRDGASPLDMFGYDVIVHASGAGSVTYNGWTNAIPTWQVLEAFRSSGGDASVSYIAPGDAAVPGKYKLGTFNISVVGTPDMSFLTNNVSLGGGAPFTGFGGSCSGTVYNFVMILGADFTDACGSFGVDSSNPTTWGAIKSLYR